MRWLVPAILACVFEFACGSSSTTSNHDASPASDALSNFHLPEVPVGCPPAAGNENGIGTPCTKTGAECTGSLKCSCQDWYGYAMPASMPCFCTSVTFGNTCTPSCGSNATCCPYNVPVGGSTIAISACFPAVCAPNNECPSITQ